mmetsp:Transcript_12002/g.29142  ORF Transcript_12002/g.29142 Transcript_12002/m.29142 type:complete len:486 (+) Transcript_12002:786-2243(+)
MFGQLTPVSQFVAQFVHVTGIQNGLHRAGVVTQIAFVSLLRNLGPVQSPGKGEHRRRIVAAAPGRDGIFRQFPPQNQGRPVGHRMHAGIDKIQHGLFQKLHLPHVHRRRWRLGIGRELEGKGRLHPFKADIVRGGGRAEPRHAVRHGLGNSVIRVPVQLRLDVMRLQVGASKIKGNGVEQTLTGGHFQIGASQTSPQHARDGVDGDAIGIVKFLQIAVALQNGSETVGHGAVQLFRLFERRFPAVHGVGRNQVFVIHGKGRPGRQDIGLRQSLRFFARFQRGRGGSVRERFLQLVMKLGRHQGRGVHLLRHLAPCRIILIIAATTTNRWFVRGQTRVEIPVRSFLGNGVQGEKGRGRVLQLTPFAIVIIVLMMIEKAQIKTPMFPRSHGNGRHGVRRYEGPRIVVRRTQIVVDGQTVHLRKDELCIGQQDPRRGIRGDGGRGGRGFVIDIVVGRRKILPRRVQLHARWQRRHAVAGPRHAQEQTS